MEDNGSVQPIAASIVGAGGILPAVTKKAVCIPRHRKRLNEDGSSCGGVTEKRSVRGKGQRKKAKAPCLVGHELAEMSTTSETGMGTDIFDDLENEPALNDGSAVSKPAAKKRKAVTAVKRRRKKAVSSTRSVVLEYQNPTLVLLIDRREIGGNRKPDDGHDLEALMRTHAPTLPYDVRTLALGDFVWICRVKEIFREEPLEASPDDADMEEKSQERMREFILPWIIERKTLSDLLSSVQGARYHSQKSRLMQFLEDKSVLSANLETDCPLTSMTRTLDPMAVLLVESCHDPKINQPIFHHQYYELPDNKSARSTVVSAQINSQARDGLMLLHTSNLEHTVQMVAKLHNALDRKFSQLISHHLDIVVDQTAKSRRLSFVNYGARYRPGAQETATSILESQLRLVPGVTPAVASILAAEYQTPAKLVAALRQFASMTGQGRLLLSGVGQKALEGLHVFLLGTKLPSGNAGVEQMPTGKRPSIRLPVDEDIIVNDIVGSYAQYNRETPTADAERMVKRIRERESIDASLRSPLRMTPAPAPVAKVSPERAGIGNPHPMGMEEAPGAPRRMSVLSVDPCEESLPKGRKRVSVIEY